jgi:cytochrome c2
MAQNDDAPFGVFRGLYTMSVWVGTLVLLLVLAWLASVLFNLTPSGTAQMQSLAVVRPTVTALAATAAAGAGPAGAAGGPVQLPVACAACHTIAGTSAAGKVCPDLTHIATVAAERIASADYTGSATTVAEYIHESIVDPNAFIVPGAAYQAAGNSLMPAAVGGALSPNDLDALVAGLAAQE